MSIRIKIILALGLFAGAASARRLDAVFDQNCASCHETGKVDRKALSDAQKRALAEYIGGRKLGTVDAGSSWNGWSADGTNNQWCAGERRISRRGGSGDSRCSSRHRDIRMSPAAE